MSDHEHRWLPWVKGVVVSASASWDERVCVDCGAIEARRALDAEEKRALREADADVREFRRGRAWLEREWKRDLHAEPSSPAAEHVWTLPRGIEIKVGEEWPWIVE